MTDHRADDRAAATNGRGERPAPPAPRLSAWRGWVQAVAATLMPGPAPTRVLAWLTGCGGIAHPIVILGHPVAHPFEVAGYPGDTDARRDRPIDARRTGPATLRGDITLGPDHAMAILLEWDRALPEDAAGALKEMLHAVAPALVALLTCTQGYREALFDTPVERRAILYLDRRGRLTGTSRRAQPWLAAQTLLVVSGDVIATRAEIDATALDRLIALSGTVPRGYAFARADGLPTVITAETLDRCTAADLPFTPAIALTVITAQEVSNDELAGFASAFGWTGREREVARQLASGMPAQAMAQSLQISPQTLSVHIRNLLQKSGLRRQIDLVRLTQRV